MVLENGKQYEGDILIGADGIWSEVKYTIPFLLNLFKKWVPFSDSFWHSISFVNVFLGAFKTLWLAES